MFPEVSYLANTMIRWQNMILERYFGFIWIEPLMNSNA